MKRMKLPALTAIRLLDSSVLMNNLFGISFNSMITLNFKQAGLDTQAEKAAKFEELNKAISRRFRAFDTKWRLEGTHPYCYVYVHELVAEKGHHVHQLIAMHPSLHLSFDHFIKRWATKNLPRADTTLALHYRGLEFPRHYTSMEIQAKLLRYVLKSSADGCWEGSRAQPVTLHSILEIHGSNRLYSADVPRPAGSSQNIARRARMDVTERVFKFLPIDELLTGDHLETRRRRIASDEFAERLRRIDI